MKYFGRLKEDHMMWLSLRVSATFLVIIAFVFAGPEPFTAIAATNSPYSQWSNGPSTDPNFFPISVWLQSPPNAQEYKNIGVNMFIGFYGDLDQASLSQLAAAQMPVVPTQNTVGLTSPQPSWIQGWDQMDEPDNAQPDGNGGYGPCLSPNQVVAAYNAIRANDTIRPVFLNFGRGVSDVNWNGRGSCTGDTAYYPSAMQGGDIISFDIYPVANYNGQLELVPNGVDNLKTWSNNSKIIWSFIEASNIGGGGAPTSAQERAEVWMSLIHGSQGIMYFVHQFSPAFREDGIFNYPSLVQAVSAINAQIASLAPVLNSPTIADGVQTASSPSSVPVDTMEKQYGGSTYVFAVAMRNNSTAATFTVVGNQSGTITVLGENRQVTMTNGQFQDSFSGYAVHLYQFTPGVSSAPAPPTSLKAIVH
jgi:hypothetical protein